MILNISKEQDINILMLKAKEYFKNYGISDVKVIELTTIISELGYNIVKYTKNGTIKFNINDQTVTIIASDKGSGIQDIENSISEGYSSSGTLGLGLNAIVRLSDEFDIQTSKNGTTIVVTKVIK